MPNASPNRARNSRDRASELAPDNSRSLSYDSPCLSTSKPITDIYEARPSVRPLTIDPVTGATICRVHISVAESNGNLIQTNDSSDLLGIQNESIAIGIEG